MSLSISTTLSRDGILGPKGSVVTAKFPDLPIMQKQRYLINYSNAHWCGGGLYCVVWAEDEDHAREVAGDFMDETQYELFADHYADEPEYQDDCPTTVDSVELFDENHEDWKFFLDPSQASFYPVVGEPN